MVNPGAASAIHGAFSLNPWALVLYGSLWGLAVLGAGPFPLVFHQTLGFWGSWLTLGLPVPWSSVSWILPASFPSIPGFWYLMVHPGAVSAAEPWEPRPAHTFSLHHNLLARVRRRVEGEPALHSSPVALWE